MSVDRTPGDGSGLTPARMPAIGVAPSFDARRTVVGPVIWSRLAEGRGLLRAGDLAAAQAIAESVLEVLQPDAGSGAPSHDVLAAAATARTLLGLVLDERGDTAAARETLRAAVDCFDRGGSRTGRGVVSYAEGLALVRLGEPVAAEAALRRAFREGEDTPDQRRTLAMALRDQGRSSEAYELLRKAVDRSADWRAKQMLAALADELDEDVATRADLWSEAAVTLASVERYVDALDAVTRADQLSRTPESRFRLARAQTRVGLVQDALGTLADLEQDTGGTAETAILRAEVLDVLGRPGEAVEAADRAAREQPRDVGLLERRATVLAGADEHERLLVAARELRELGSTRAEFFHGYALLRTGRAEEAVEPLRRAVASDHSSANHGLLAEALIENDENDEALHELGTAIELDADYEWARTEHARLLFVAGEDARAIHELRGLVGDRPDSAVGRYYLGEMLRVAGDFREAVTHLTRAVELDPTSTSAWRSVALVHSVPGGDRDEAGHAFRSMLDLDPGSVEARLGLVELLLEQEAAEESVTELLDEALELDPHSAQVHALLGEVARRSAAWDVALARFERALEIDPSYGYARGSRGQVILESGGASQDAIDDLEAAARLAPDQVWVRYTLADAYEAAGEAENADQTLAAIGRENRSDPMPWRARAQLWDRAGRPERVEKMLRGALRRAPDDADVRLDLAEHLVYVGRAREAFDQLDAVDEAWRRDDRWQFLRGSALADVGDVQGAFDVLVPLASRAAQAVGVAQRLGELCRRVGRYDEAETWFERALAADPASWWSLGSRGAMRRVRGEIDAAERDLRRSLELRPRYVFAASELAELLAGRGQVDEALEVFEAMLADEQQDPDALAMYGYHLELAGRSEEALEALEQALWVKPDYPFALRVLGGVMLRLHRQAESLSCLRRAVAAAADDPAALVECAVDLAGALHEVGEVDEAWEVVLQTVRTAPGYPGAWLGVAEVATRAGSYDAAIDAATRAVAAQLLGGASYRALGEAWERSGRPDSATRALAAYERALELEVDDIWARKGRANSLRLLGRADEARADYQLVHERLAVRALPPDVKPHLDGWCLLHLGRPGEAVRTLHSALPTAWWPASIYFDLTLVALTAGRASTASSYIARGVAEVRREPARLRWATLAVALADLEGVRHGLPDEVHEVADAYAERLQLLAAEADGGEPLVIPDDVGVVAS